jgi:hypothetical protein
MLRIRCGSPVFIVVVIVIVIVIIIIGRSRGSYRR